MSSPLNLPEILGKIDDGICVLTPDGKAAFANDKAAQILEQVDEVFQNSIQQAMQAETAACFGHFHAALNRWFEHRTYPNADGGLTLISCDVTSRRQAETALQSSEERFRRLMRSVIEGSAILASSLECEKTFPELSEFIVSRFADSCLIVVQEGQQLVRMAAAHSIPFTPELELQTALTRVINTGKSEISTSPKSRLLVAIPMRSKIAGALAVASAKPNAFDAEDVQLFEVLGRRAGVALENARLYRETQQANRLKDEFVAMISHELRTPLTPILGGVYMMRSEPQDRNVIARALDLIERSAKTQVKIIDDLLDVSRALSGKLRLSMEPVDLPGVIQAAVETVRPAIEAKDILVDLRLAPVRGIVLGDADRLQQVVWNLLANAVKFTPKGGLIAVELSEKAGQAEIRVSDTGIGIDADFLPYVFERFRQADASRTRPHGGLGLGLAIVRHLVESHGGTVQADSSGGQQGSTFVVRLPLRSAAAQKATATE